MTAPAPAEPDLKLLASHLEALASEARLSLLRQLRTPKELNAIRLQAGRSRPGENAERPMARQSVSHHLAQLEGLGLVYRHSGEAGAGERFTLNHQRLFALVDELRALTRLRPDVLQPVAEGTISGAADGVLLLPDAPRLTVAYGWQDGLSFPLHGPVGSRWRIGRAPSCEVALDHDPYVSAENCVVERTGSGHVLRDVPGNRNGTQLNWSPLPPGGSARLQSGDVVGAGRTLLVAQL
jgi:DNA-binding transcriptional ArsR family regulator